MTPIKAEHDEIIALVPENWPPQYQIDENGRPFGFAISILEEVASIAGYRVVYKVYPNFSKVVDALSNGEGDLIPNSGILADRANEFIFTSPVETFFVRIIARSEDPSIDELSDLIGKKVSVVDKNVGLLMLQGRQDISLKVERDLQDALLSLISGSVDALVYPGSVALTMARNAGIDHRIKLVGQPLKEVKRGIRFLKDRIALRDELDTAVEQFIKTDDYVGIYEEWYGKPTPLLSSSALKYLFISAIVLMSIVFIAWRHFSLQRLNKELTQKNHERLGEIEQALSEKEILVQEIHHRVKNNLQVILSMLSLQRRAAEGEHEVHALVEGSRRVRVMAKLYEHLYQSENVSDIRPEEYLSEVLNDALHAAGAPDGVEANLDCDDVTLKIKTATALAQIISELISNCLKHAFPDGKGHIDVSLKRVNEKELCLSVSDDGVGLPDGFDEKKLKSMGMKLVNALVMQIGGTKQLKSNGGTTVEITFEETA